MNSEFKTKLREMINECDIDVYVNMPDFLLAEHIVKFIEQLKKLNDDRDLWFGHTKHVNEGKQWKKINQ